jgi:hypothetical protein
MDSSTPDFRGIPASPPRCLTRVGRTGPVGHSPKLLTGAGFRITGRHRNDSADLSDFAEDSTKNTPTVSVGVFFVPNA